LSGIWTVWEHRRVAELVVEGDQLVVRLSWWERLAAVHGNVRVPLAAVASARVEARSADLLQRLFRRDSYGPAFLQAPYGVRGGYFVAARRRRPAVLVDLGPPSRLAGLLVSVADPEATAARIMDGKPGRRGTEGNRSADVTSGSQPPRQVQARRLWLPWRPRLRLVFAYPRALDYVAAALDRFDRWVGRRFTGWLRPVMVGILLLPYLAARLIGFVLVFEITIIAFTASVCLVLGEWLLLALVFPVALASRLASVRPWPLVAIAGPQRWTARVAGWSASGKAAGGAAGVLTSGAGLAAPPWSPGARAAQIWK